MSKLYACIGRRAETPYCIPADGLKVYTIEEICYYICDRAEVLDADFMCDELAEFVEHDLGLPKLADELFRIIRFGGSLHAFCGLLLDGAAYSEKEVRNRTEALIKENETLPVIYRLKKQGDIFVQEKRYYKAQQAYRNLLLREDVCRDTAFAAEIYSRLGNLAAIMFQYETAAYCFEKSLELEQSDEVCIRYLLCQRFLMTKDKYRLWLAGHEEYGKLSVEAERLYEEADEQAERQIQNKSEQTDPLVLKEEYCQMVLEQV